MYHANLMGLLVRKFCGNPRLAWGIRCSNVFFRDYRPVTRWIVECCSHLSAFPEAIVVNSQAGIRHHVRIGYKLARMRCIPNGFDLEHFRPDPAVRASVRYEFGLPEDALIIGLVARWDPLKDHGTFIKAAFRIAGQHEKAYFLLIGKGMDWNNRQLVSLFGGVEFQDRMLLLGAREDIPRLTVAFDIACSSSISEGFPNTVGEAMASGVPCVVTDTGDSASIVSDTGYVVPCNDAAALASACLKLIEMDRVRRQELGLRARKRIEQHYALADTVREYEKLYTTLVKGR
jgi:glycosyltransferase involved in cell wall biosynthesis